MTGNLQVDPAHRRAAVARNIAARVQPARPIPPGLSITRRPNGAIDQIVGGYANQGTVTTNGIDFRANTNFDFGNWGELLTLAPLPFNINTPGNCPGPWRHPAQEPGGAPAVGERPVMRFV